MNNYSKEPKIKLTLDELETLMDDHSNSLFIFIKGVVKSNEIAEELVSDVFVKLWEKRDMYPTINDIQSYLFILARNEAISFLRKRNKLHFVHLENIQEYYSVPLESSDPEEFNREMVEKINEAIETLPAKCKMAFSLAKISGLKYKEIAEIMNISPNTVKNHIVYAFNKICASVGVMNEEKSTASIMSFFILSRKNMCT